MLVLSDIFLIFFMNLFIFYKAIGKNEIAKVCVSAMLTH